MLLKICEIVSITLLALVAGVFWGPWLAISRSLATFEPAIFLDIAHRLIRNLESVMPILMPAAILSIVPVLFLTWRSHPAGFYLSVASFASSLIALLITMLVEVPISLEIKTWSLATMPANWQQIRDRWGAFHIARIVAGMGSLVLLVTAAVC
jgi:hypothetical protein